MRQLRAFAEAFRTNNLTHAAQKLHLSQPAVSALIRQFEESLGVQLFERGPRALRPTKTANEAIRDVEHILAKVSELETKMREKAAKDTRVLAFTCVPALTMTIVPEVIAEFNATMPGVEVLIVEQAFPSLLKPVLDEECEFNLSPFPYDSTAVEAVPLIVGQVCAIFGPKSRLNALADVTWQDLMQERIITAQKDKVLQEVLRQQQTQVSGETKPILNIEFIQTALALAANDVGVLLGPAYLAQWSPHNKLLQTRKLENPSIEQGLLMHVRHGHVLSGPAQHFLELLRRKLESLPLML